MPAKPQPPVAPSSAPAGAPDVIPNFAAPEFDEAAAKSAFESEFEDLFKGVTAAQEALFDDVFVNEYRKAKGKLDDEDDAEARTLFETKLQAKKDQVDAKWIAFQGAMNDLSSGIKSWLNGAMVRTKNAVSTTIDLGDEFGSQMSKLKFKNAEQAVLGAVDAYFNVRINETAKDRASEFGDDTTSERGSNALIEEKYQALLAAVLLAQRNAHETTVKLIQDELEGRRKAVRVKETEGRLKGVDEKISRHLDVLLGSLEKEILRTAKARRGEAFPTPNEEENRRLNELRRAFLEGLIEKLALLKERDGGSGIKLKDSGANVLLSFLTEFFNPATDSRTKFDLERALYEAVNAAVSLKDLIDQQSGVEVKELTENTNLEGLEQLQLRRGLGEAVLRAKRILREVLTTQARSTLKDCVTSGLSEPRLEEALNEVNAVSELEFQIEINNLPTRVELDQARTGLLVKQVVEALGATRPQAVDNTAILTAIDEAVGKIRANAGVLGANMELLKNAVVDSMRTTSVASANIPTADEIAEAVASRMGAGAAPASAAPVPPLNIPTMSGRPAYAPRAREGVPIWVKVGAGLTLVAGLCGGGWWAVDRIKGLIDGLSDDASKGTGEGTGGEAPVAPEAPESSLGGWVLIPNIQMPSVEEPLGSNLLAGFASTNGAEGAVGVWCKTDGKYFTRNEGGGLLVFPKDTKWVGQERGVQLNEFQPLSVGATEICKIVSSKPGFYAVALTKE